MDVVSINFPFDGEPVDSWFRDKRESGTPYEARRCEMVLDFLDALRRDVVGPRLFACRFDTRPCDQFWLHYAASNGCKSSIKLVIDHMDYGPVEDGLPRFHYRLECTLQQSDGRPQSPRIEERTHSVEAACQFVRDAIERTRRGW